MKKIPTLLDVKESYFRQLEELVGTATLDELNELSNRIHSGLSQNRCGVWQPEKQSFSFCQNENCQMLSETLGIWATMPSGRPEFLTFTFDGNCERRQRSQIAGQYFAKLPEHQRELYYLAYSRLLSQNQTWTDIQTLTELIHKQLEEEDKESHITDSMQDLA
ncbi:hypothetical protein M5252_004571 [Vibrio parahaemolyticus]|nr:hypothetical protein [Vibrio parahaemolyticus]EJE8775018.1 hypothetical protein [Vibrio parahaemolyticus]